MFKQSIVAFAFALFSCAAAAQTAADEAQRRELAESIMKIHYEIVDPRSLMQGMLRELDGQFRQMIESPQSKIPKDKQAEALAIVQEEVRAYVESTMPIIDRIRTASADLFATKYTVDELKALYAFTNSDLGRKNLGLVMKELPALIGPAMQGIQPLALEMSKKIQSRLGALVR